MVTRIETSSFLSGTNATFIAELYGRYLDDPASVDPSWAVVFAEFRDEAQVVAAELDGAPWARLRRGVIGRAEPNGNGIATIARVAAAPGEDAVRSAALDSVRALMLIRAYRERGHHLADLDPLGLAKIDYHPELDYKTYGFVDGDLDRPIFVGPQLGQEIATLGEILSILNDTYCGRVAVEFTHVQDPEQKAWIRQRIENIRNHTDFTVRGRQAILERLTAAEVFEHFLDRKYIGTKRFGLEGAEAIIPALEQIIKRGSQLGLDELSVGMAHRGRLNVLANFLGKSFKAIFSEFQGMTANPEDVQGSGDVKYHLGTSSDREFDGKVVHLSLLPNPSHLEAVNPIVLGKVRAKQEQSGDVDRTKVMGLLLHGDAAFIGQGMVAETLQLSELRGYRTGGTIHLVINNQIGFTTSPTEARTGPYCSDVAKIVQAPVFHVNGDDPEAVVHVARIATEYRYQFKRDVVIDMYCYRRQGHNESDEPAFTQPLMVAKIASHPTTRAIYAERLVAEGVVTPDEPQRMIDSFRAGLEEEFNAAKSYKPNKADWLEGAWTGLGVAGDDRRGETAVGVDVLREVGFALCRPPETFDVNPKIRRQLETRKAMIETGQGLDWATGEALAFGTLVVEGTKVRLSGQDSGRGTFSQRHAVLVDQTTAATHVPLQHIRKGQAGFEVFDSPLAEASVLGFEYGYTLAEPRALVMWEAQFGDFANGAQVIIDQFISSAESKWLRLSGLVMLLPHGYEGQGPEHSSARLERYLQLCAEDNLQVVYPSTPASYFHALRRQVRRNFRKPLIVMTPKSLLRHKLCVSSLAEFGPGSSFHRVLPETGEIAAKDVRRVVLCSGKVYFDLVQARDERKIKSVALIRLEQLYPFPEKTLARELARYPKADVVWCQEEPRNMGSWTFVEHRIETVLNGNDHKVKRPIYVGRPESASPATGSLKRHNQEQARLVDDALSIG
ncbi:MAG: 2-oxoglutarate dehydrogenase E1 component [Alphaproteobacteria bacterium]|nr:2-oxoglutarate dehydrogenase E1 component [Alphaproteobacteria bacterium]